MGGLCSDETSDIAVSCITTAVQLAATVRSSAHICNLTHSLKCLHLPPCRF